MMAQIERIVNLYRTLAQFPTPTAGRILQINNLAVISWWTQRNLETGKLIKFQQYHFYDSSSHKSFNTLPSDTSNELLSSISQSEKFKAVLREIPCDRGSKKQYIEIWKDSFLWKNFDLTALEVHGDVYADADFSSFEWSPCEEKLLYIAEKKVAKSEPFYKPKSQGSKSEESGDKVTKGDEYLYRQDWGEQLAGKSQSVIAVCNIKTDTISVLQGIPNHFCPGQVVWTVDGDGIVGVVWNTKPRKLGLIYCTNRESYIFHLANCGEFSLLSGERRAVRSPRMSPNGKYLVWLEREAGGPHHGAHQLICYTWDTKSKNTIIDIVKNKTTIKDGEVFYGLYNLALPKRCWTSSNQVILSTPQRCTVNSYIVDIVSKQISAIKYDEGSCSVLDVWNNMLVCTKSSFKKSFVLSLGRLEEDKTICWQELTQNTGSPLLDGLACHYMSLTQNEELESPVRNFSAIYVGPTSSQNCEIPLIVCPHGGPHGSSCNSFSLEIALFGLLGYGVLLVNYRGSVGSGQDSVDSLLGRIGDSDVKDVRLATQKTLEEFTFLNPNKVVLLGRSHGGFLVTHLSGQYPNEYKAVVAGNPVIDCAAMFSVTDIPDWNCVETGYAYKENEEVSTEAFEKMKKCSPINYVSNVIAPTLLLLGKKDARVPDTQGLYYYHALKARNVETKLLIYDDNHPLSQVPVEMDHVINTILWFGNHS